LRGDARLKFNAMPEIVIVQALAIRHAELHAIHVEFVAIHDGPQRALRQRKFAGEYAGLQSGRVRLPVRADEIRRESAKRRTGSASWGFMGYQKPHRLSSMA